MCSSRCWSPGISWSSPQQFFRSYLVGFWFWFGMGMGCLVLLMTHLVTGGAWGVMIRRPLEAGSRTIPVMWLLFLPLLLSRRSSIGGPTRRMPGKATQGHRAEEIFI